MAKVGSAILGAPQDLFVSTSNQQADLGALMATGDGNWYRYAFTGATALVSGTLLQAPAQITTHQQLTPTATSATIVANTQAPASTTVGTNVYPTITVTLGATNAVTANQYAGGWVSVSADSGSGGVKGAKYSIISHPAAAAAASLTLTLGEGIFNLVTTSAKIDLITNPCNGVIIAPTTLTGAPVGVAIMPSTINFYGWIQVGGIASILNDAGGTITVGNSVVPSTTVAGAIKSATGTLPVIGVSTQTAIASVNSLFRLDSLL